jgi:hypothetical protein
MGSVWLIALFFLIPVAAVFICLCIALYWPSRFSLRSLLVIFTAIAVVLGTVSALMRWPK